MRFLASAFVAALLGGCVSTVEVVREANTGVVKDTKEAQRPAPAEKVKPHLTTTAQVNEQAASILSASLAVQLTRSELLADGNAAGAPTLEVNVTNYRVRSGASRALLGAFAGSDNIQSTVKLKDTLSGKVLAEYKVETTNSSAIGSARGLLEEHADAIVQILKGGTYGVSAPAR